MVSSLIVAAALLMAEPRRPAADDAARAAEATALAEYNARRAKVAGTADAHWRLGLWCEQNGLKGEATTEFVAVTRLDAGRDSAWKKLGYEKHDGRWTTPAALAADRAEADAQKKADARWIPLLARWKSWLRQKAKRAEADRELAAVTDPRAVPAIWKAFADGGPDDQERAIDVLGRIEGARSSHALAVLAIYGRTEGVRRAAVETLARRKADDVLLFWIGQLRDPVKYEVRPMAGPGSPGVLTVDGQRFNVRRFYASPSMFETQRQFLGDALTPPPAMPHIVVPLQFNSDPPGPPPGSKYVGYDFTRKKSLFVYDFTWKPPPSGLDPPRTSPDPMGAYQTAERRELQAEANLAFALGETAKMAEGAQMRLQADIDAIESSNASTREANARLASALRRVAGEPKLGEGREEWLRWWMEHRGYAYVPPKDRPKATVDVRVPLPYVPTNGPASLVAGGGSGGGSGWCLIWDHEKGKKPKTDVCFAAGTPVLTRDGPRPIESIARGDRVLTRDGPDSPPRETTVADVHRSSSPRALRLVVVGESIVATAGHPIWRVGRGWTRADDLAPGDDILALGGPIRVESIEAVGSATVTNLLVPDGASFLVGRLGLLAHDGGPTP